MKANLDKVHAAIQAEHRFPIKWGVYEDHADHIFANRMIAGVAFVGYECLVGGEEFFVAYEMEEDGDSLVITNDIGFPTREDTLHYLDQQMLSWYIEFDDRGELR